MQDNLGEPVLSQRRDLLERPQDFYEPDVIPATQHIVSLHYRKMQWFGSRLALTCYCEYVTVGMLQTVELWKV